MTGHSAATAAVPSSKFLLRYAWRSSVYVTDAMIYTTYKAFSHICTLFQHVQTKSIRIPPHVCSCCTRGVASAVHSLWLFTKTPYYSNIGAISRTATAEGVRRPVKRSPAVPYLLCVIVIFKTQQLIAEVNTISDEDVHRRHFGAYLVHRMEPI